MLNCAEGTVRSHARRAFLTLRAHPQLAALVNSEHPG
jgi:DNA-directed RNA polymerase specialized sigma24 family protein